VRARERDRKRERWEMDGLLKVTMNKNVPKQRKKRKQNSKANIQEEEKIKTGIVMSK
jgi:hypothetical protein